MAADFAREPAAQFPDSGHRRHLCLPSRSSLRGMRSFYALVSFGLLSVRGAHGADGVLQRRARHLWQERSMNLLRAAVELTHRNTRRYGGYLVHMGIVLMFIGFTGHAFNQSRRERTEHRRLDADRRLRPEDGRFEAGRKRQLHVASRHHGRSSKGRTDRHARARKALLQSQPAGDFRSRPAHAAQ